MVGGDWMKKAITLLIVLLLAGGIFIYTYETSNSSDKKYLSLIPVEVFKNLTNPLTNDTLFYYNGTGYVRGIIREVPFYTEQEYYVVIKNDTGYTVFWLYYISRRGKKNVHNDLQIMFYDKYGNLRYYMYTLQLPVREPGDITKLKGFKAEGEMERTGIRYFISWADIIRQKRIYHGYNFNATLEKVLHYRDREILKVHEYFSDNVERILYVDKETGIVLVDIFLGGDQTAFEYLYRISSVDSSIASKVSKFYSELYEQG